MQTKPLLYGLVGFFLGGLLVATAATTFDKPKEKESSKPAGHSNSMTMDAMTNALKDKRGEEYDMLFINYMIDHHQAAVDMAKLSAQHAKHDEIKQLSTDIINAQEKEISQMRQWQQDWGRPTTHHNDPMGH